MRKIKIGITMGDPSGIGSEIISKALGDPKIRNLAEFLIIGDRWVFEKIQNSKFKIQNFEFINLKNVPKKNFRFGRVLPVYGRASLEYLNKAIQLIKEDKIQALVTAPVSKEAINLAGIRFQGHTEYLAKRFGVKDFAMMLVAGNLKVTLVTRHLALRKVASKINKEEIYKIIILTHKYLSKFFGIEKPKIAICALNPHAGEKGILGDEEERIISPAINLVRRNPGLARKGRVFGPEPADSAFFSAYRGLYDGIICMYHDQGIIPLKMLSRERCVNLTIGLPFVRTSPLHGTAFDIAGKNKANPSSLIEAIKLAYRCTAIKKD